MDDTIGIESRINLQDAAGNTALHRAVIKPNCKQSEIQQLLDNGAHINKVNKQFLTPLQCALLRTCGRDVIELLLNKEIDDNQFMRDGFLLHCALQNSWLTDPDVIEMLLNRGVAVNAANDRGTTPLHHVAKKPCPERIVKQLLCFGASVNSVDSKGETPLHHSVSQRKFNFFPNNCCNTIQLVKLLLKHKANVNQPNSITGLSPLSSAVLNPNCSVEVIKLLLNSGALVNERDHSNNLALHHALENPRLNIVKCLLDYNSQINVQNSVGDFPLHKATKNSKCNQELVKLLLDHKALVNVSDIFSNTPLHLAIRNTDCNCDVIKLLVGFGASINTFDCLNKSPLYYAVSKGNPNCIKFLLENGAFVNKQNNAVVNKQINTIKSLLKVTLGCKFVHPAVRLESAKYLIRYTFIESLDFDIEDLFKQCSHSVALSHFANECVSEIVKMDSESVGCNTTLRELIRGHRRIDFDKKGIGEENKLLAYDTDKVFKILAINKYPLYREVILAKVKRVAMLNQLRNHPIYALTKSCNQCYIVAYCYVCIVANYLPDDDLSNLILAFQNANDDTPIAKYLGTSKKRLKLNS